MKLRIALACAASALATSMAAGPGYAQQSDKSDKPDTVKEVVVTGVRASLKSALANKKNADQISDSVVAEDIGKLPDNNVIEALQHVTGIQVSRNAAEANQLLIRGLPDIATLLNGREIFTSTGRFITLQDIPAELLSRVDVEKSSRADDIEGGIAGLVDVRLHRPFDFPGMEVAGGAHGTYSSLSGKYDPDANLLLSNRWMTSGGGEFGFLVDGFYSRRQYKEEILDNYISTQGIPYPSAPGGTAFIPLTEGAQSIPGDRKRFAVDAAAQWRPNPQSEFFAEFFYTGYRNPNSNDFFVGLPWICANPATATIFPGTNEVKKVTAGCYDLTSNQSFLPSTDTYQASIGGNWTSDRLTFSTEGDYTDSKFSQTGYILDTEYYPPPDGYTADFNYNGTGTPFMNVTGVNMADPSQFHIRQFYDQWVKQSGNEFDWRADLVFKTGAASGIKSIDAGVRFSDRFAKNRADNPGGLDCRADLFAARSSPQYPAIAAAAASQACFTPLSALTPAGASHLTSGSQFDGQFGISAWTDADPNWLNTNIGSLRQLFGQSALPPPEDPTQSFDDRELSYAGYVKANFAFDAGALPVDGNIGLRVIDTHADMKGNQVVITGIPANAPTSFSFTYVPTASTTNTLDWLPSLNLRLMMKDDLWLRLGASRTVTRPTFAQLNPGLSLSATTGTLLGSGSKGNPDLKPVTSDNLDLSLEYYFGPQSAITVAAFYRRIDGYIQTAVSSQTIGGVNYGITSPVNAPAGHIDGVELAYTQFFDFLPGPLAGLGLQANGTYVDGQFQNISKWSYNLVGIYERGPVSVRVAYNWRDGFNVGPAPPGGHNPGTIFAKPQPWLDLSASYKLTQRITFTLDATNLLNSYYQDYFTDPVAYPRDTRRFDQTIVLGIRFRM
jgi:TonB-dependent receptor